jgi:hypothetical protein
MIVNGFSCSLECFIEIHYNLDTCTEGCRISFLFSIAIFSSVTNLLFFGSGIWDSIRSLILWNLFAYMGLVFSMVTLINLASRSRGR